VELPAESKNTREVNMSPTLNEEVASPELFDHSLRPAFEYDTDSKKLNFSSHKPLRMTNQSF